MPDTLPPLLWMAPALAGGGYSSEAITFALGLAPRLTARGFALRQFADQPDQGFMSGLPASTTEVLQPVVEFPGQNRFDARLRRRGVVVCHATPDAWVPSKFPGWDELAPCPPKSAAFTVGRTMFETDSMPTEWVERCNRMDEVWVPTEFHRDAFAAAGVAAAKLVVVGEPVDTAFYDPSVHAPLPLPRLTGTPAGVTPFRFLSVFKWEARKGWDALLSAFFAEFGADEPVELLLKTKPFHSSDDFEGLVEEWAAERELPASRPPLRIVGSEYELSELPRLYAAADAFVLPSRGEGWGRPHVEAMAMGLPVIATNWSGPTAFLDETVGYPLEYTLQPVPDELNLPGHHWAEPSVAHLRALMRRLVSHPDEARGARRAARERMVSRYRPEALAIDIEAELRRIGEVLEARRQSKASGGGTKRVRDEL